MPDGGEGLTAAFLGGIAEAGAAEWDACAGTSNPFVRHAFLHALEESGSARAETGWLPRHLVLRDASGRIAAAAPMYLKAHSDGEYVFDHAWADAYERAGGRYYPKLQVAVPFTPAAGPRLLAPPGGDAARAALARALVEAAETHGVSSLHVTYPTGAECRGLEVAGFMTRLGCQFQWTNRGYESFADFLADLSSRKRKAILKERREVAESGVRIEILSGGAVTEEHWDAFHRFYLATIGRKWGRPYLTRSFFSLIGAAMPESIVLVMARRGGAFVAGALNLLGEDALYGRYWGCEGTHKFLHFEMCYYRAIDFAIAGGLKRVEAGAQGAHKIQRGYLPHPTYSAHWIRDPGFEAAVRDFLPREREAVEEEMRALAELSPFRRVASAPEGRDLRRKARRYLNS